MADETPRPRRRGSAPIPFGVIEAMPLMEDGVLRVLIWLFYHEYTAEGWQVPVRLAEIARGVGLPAERVRRALLGMTEQGMVLKLPDKRYVLSLPLDEDESPEQGRRGGEAGKRVEGPEAPCGSP